MRPLEFTKEALKKVDDSVIELLRRVLRELGAKDVDEMVGDFHSKAPNLLQMIAELEARRDETSKRLDSLVANKTALEERKDEAHRNHFMADQAYWKAHHESSGSGDLLLWEQLTQAEAAFQAAQAEFIAAAGTFPSAHRALNQELAAIEAELAPKRNALRESDRLFAILDQHRVLLNQQMWMRIDAYTWRRKLAGTTYPDAPYKGQSIGGLVDPTPLGYFGNYVAFAWNFPQDGKTAAAHAEAFEQMYTMNTSTSARIALPTEGVFAEAVLGQSNSAEKIDITRFWNWGDSPIPILPPSMTPVGTQSRARDVAVPAPLNFAPAQAVLQEAGVLPEVINNALAALQTSIVGDNAELIAAAATAGLTASKHAAEGAGRAGQRVVDAMKNAQDFTVGLANSEVAKIATQAVIGGATASASSVGGLLNAARAANAAGDGSRAGNGVGASGKAIKAAATDAATRVAKGREGSAVSGSSARQPDGPAQPGRPARPRAASVGGESTRDAPRSPNAPGPARKGARALTERAMDISDAVLSGRGTLAHRSLVKPYQTFTPGSVGQPGHFSLKGDKFKDIVLVNQNLSKDPDCYYQTVTFHDRYQELLGQGKSEERALLLAQAHANKRENILRAARAQADTPLTPESREAIRQSLLTGTLGDYGGLAGEPVKLVVTVGQITLDIEVEATLVNESMVEPDRGVVLGKPFTQKDNKKEKITIKNKRPMTVKAAGSVTKGTAHTEGVRIGFVQSSLSTVRAARYEDSEDGTYFILEERQPYPHRDGGNSEDDPWYRVTGSTGMVELTDAGFEISMSDDPTFAVPLVYLDNHLKKVDITDKFVTCIMVEIGDRGPRHYIYVMRWNNIHNHCCPVNFY